MVTGLWGLKVLSSPAMVDGPFEDWSNVRSPGRARRRRRKHRQNIRIYYTPKREFIRLLDGTLVGHPAMVAELRKAAEAERRRLPDNVVALGYALSGQGWL
jgi:hypothetical protein